MIVKDNFHLTAASTKKLQHFGLLLLTVTGLFILGQLILHPGQGIDVTDESLYILSTSSDVNWKFPFGWSTSILFDLSGQNLRTFRVLGFIVLELSSLLLSIAVYVFSNNSLGVTKSFKTLRFASFISVGLLTPLFYYGGYHRTPSYNWSNLVLINISISLLLFLFVELSGTSTLTRFSRHSLGLTFLLCFFLVYFGVAKPTTSVILSIAGFAIILKYYRPVFVKFFAVFGGSVLFSILLMVGLGIWPTNFYQVFIEASRSPTHLPQQTLGGAFSDLFESGADFYLILSDALRTSVGGATLLFVLTILFAVCTIWIRSEPGSKVSATLFLILTTGLAFMMISQFGWGRLIGRAQPASRWINSNPVEVGLISLLLMLFISPVKLLPLKYGKSSRNFSSEWRVVPFLLAIGVLAFGFGSGHTIARQVSLAAGLLLLLSHREFVFRSSSWFSIHSFVIPLVCCVGGVITISESYARPFRTAATDLSVVEIDFGTYGRQLLVEASLAEFVHDFRTAAHENGFKPGDEVAALTWRWKSFPVLMLEGTPPPSVMLTHDANLRILEYNLERHDTVGFLKRSWLLVSPENLIPEEKRAEINSLYSAISDATGRRFPDDYECVVSSPILELWSPFESGSRGPACRANIESGTSYDFDRGFLH